MNNTAIDLVGRNESRDWTLETRRLGEVFAERASGYDERGEFVAENYRDLSQAGYFSVSIPLELGGGGASFAEVCAIVRELGRHCGSTALAFAMHTHPVAVNVMKYKKGDEKAKNTLSKIASKGIIIANTGANDWLESSGEAKRVPGGYRVTARKHFVSGGPGAALLVTSVGHDGSEGREVLHFAVPTASEGVRILDNWNTLGMRGTGSNDVALDDVFVPDEAVMLRRRSGEWHPVWDAILPNALPIITSAYVGLADQAAELARRAASKRPQELAPVVGQMMNALTVAELALEDMIRINDGYGFRPGLEATEKILARKALAATHVKQTVELASELVGGAGFFRGHPMERIVRDVRAMNFHPLPVRRQELFSGRMALGLDPLKG